MENGGKFSSFFFGFFPIFPLKFIFLFMWVVINVAHKSFLVLGVEIEMKREKNKRKQMGEVTSCGRNYFVPF